LIATVVGLSVAIIAYVPYRYLRGKVDDLVIRMERETTRLMSAVRDADHDREPEKQPSTRKSREARA